jgi:hypothetical protein
MHLVSLERKQLGKLFAKRFSGRGGKKEIIYED